MDRLVTMPIVIEMDVEGGEPRFSCTVDTDSDTLRAFIFRSPNHEVYDMNFRIKPNDFNLQFLPDPIKTFWVKKENPPAPGNSERDYEPITVTEDGCLLRVLNFNHNPAQYFFAINFTSSIGPLRWMTDRP